MRLLNEEAVGKVDAVGLSMLRNGKAFKHLKMKSRLESFFLVFVYKLGWKKKSYSFSPAGGEMIFSHYLTT